MNVIPSVSGRRRSTTKATPSKIKLPQLEQRLNFYTESPMVELSIDDFELFALKRLKVSSTDAAFLLSRRMTVVSCHDESRPLQQTTSFVSISFRCLIHHSPSFLRPSIKYRS